MAYDRLTPNWTNVQAMASIGEDGYAVERGTLYRFDKAGNYTELSSGWNASAMVACKGNLYIFDGRGTLYRVDPATGGYEEMPDSWPDVSAATVVGERIYVICQTDLYAVDP